MADNEDETTTSNETEPNPEVIQAETKSGWLLKRSKISRKWKKRWFELRDRTVFYGKAPGDLPKSIPLETCEITACELKGKANTFCLKSKETQRKHFVSAETETELEEWIQAICLAKSVGRQSSGGSQACVLQ